MLNTLSCCCPNLIARLADDENGFVVSGELVLVATIGVLAMIVGLSEAAYNLNQELEDTGSAVGFTDQSFEYHLNSGHKAGVVGTSYTDTFWEGESTCDVHCDGGVIGEQ